MTFPRTALLLAALALGPALLPACASSGSNAPAPPVPTAQGADSPAARQAAIEKVAADKALADSAAADKAIADKAALEKAIAEAKASADKLIAEQAAANKAATDKAAAELRAAQERAAAEARMRHEQQVAEAAAAAEKVKADAEARGKQLAALEATKGKTAEQIAAQNGAAIDLASKSPAGKSPAAAPAASTPAPAANAPGAPAAQTAPTASTEDFTRVVAEIQTTKGSLVLEFYPDVAPLSVQNFVDLARRGFYDGMKFHRIVPGYLIQTGDPKGDGTGGAGHLKAEWSSRKHKRGTLSMARQSHPDSAGTQFFICHQENAGYDLSKLDGRYTVFGQLIRGFDVLDAIAAAGSPSGQPTEAVTMLKVIIRPRQVSDHEPGA